MKTFFLKLILIALLAWGAQYLTVWFAGPLMALVVNLFWKGSSAQGFFTGFLGPGILWFSLALCTDLQTGGILTEKMARILPLGGSRIGLVSVTAFIGALVGGLCGWTGAVARKLVRDDASEGRKK